MTTTKKIQLIKSMLDYTETDATVESYLDMADEIILGRLFPFGNRPFDAVPSVYIQNEINITIYLLNKRGAEGEKAHSENGVSRTYEDAGIPESLLANITPHAKLVFK